LNDDLATTAKTLARGNPWAFSMWLDGLTEPEQLALQTQLRFDKLIEASEALIELFRELWEAIKAAAAAVVEFIQTAAREIFNLSSVRRFFLYLDLKQRWYVPGWLALWIARHCPQRWLPAP
jgi:hypothetical protein